MVEENKQLEKGVELYQQRNKLEIFKELLELGVDCSKPVNMKDGTFEYTISGSNLSNEDWQKAVKLIKEYKN